MRKYKFNKNAGALQEAAAIPPPMKRQHRQSSTSFNRFADLDDDYVSAHDTGEFALSDLTRLAANAPVHAQSTTTTSTGGALTRMRKAPESSLDRQARYHGAQSMFFYTVEEGQRMLVVHKNGKIEVVEGPTRVYRRGKSFRSMEHHVAHPGEFLIVRYRDGRQEHRPGPVDVWLDPREHLSIQKEECFQIADREAVVVYSKGDDGKVNRRIVHGPEDFVPKPGEWLHTFSWHGSRVGSDGSTHKVPNALVFQKLWLLPDQMYHDVPEVRTADGAVLTIRLMLFFELLDIEKMLLTTHDPIGDFVNAATSDVVEFLSKHDFESFKNHIEKLNDLAAYKQLTSRAEQCGYRINKVVYRGYGAPAALQQMHDQALESRTRLQLEKATEEQAQQLQDYKLERSLARAAKEREEAALRQAQDIELSATREEAERAQQKAAIEQQQALQKATEAAHLEKLEKLHALGVDLTAYLTQNRADQVIELRGEGSPHLHLDKG